VESPNGDGAVDQSTRVVAKMQLGFVVSLDCFLNNEI
jgi:hypothetical protein